MSGIEETVRPIVRDEVRAALQDWLSAAVFEAQPGLLSLDEAAAYLGDLPVTTLRNLVKKRQIDDVKIGRSTSFKREQLDAYVDAHTVKTVEQPWGLTESSLRSIRQGSREDRVRRRTEAMDRF